MPVIIDRTLLSDHLFEGLEYDENDQFGQFTWETGDHEKPEGGGWQGEPDRSPFVPYVVLTALPSQRPSGPVGAPQADVVFPYALSCYGDSRRQVERMSFIARYKVSAMMRDKTSDGRTIMNVGVTRYGGVDRISRKPPLYTVTDQVEIWTTA